MGKGLAIGAVSFVAVCVLVPFAFSAPSWGSDCVLLYLLGMCLGGYHRDK